VTNAGDNKFIAVYYNISPATSQTCGDGSGAFCPYCHWRLDGAADCHLFGLLTIGESGKWKGWILRHTTCLVGEQVYELRNSKENTRSRDRGWQNECPT